MDYLSTKVESSKLLGLDGLLDCLQEQTLNYQEALNIAIEYTQQKNGIIEYLDNNVTRLQVYGLEAHCYKCSDGLFHFER